MQKFLKRVLIFAIPIFMLWLAAETFYRAVPNNYTIKHENITRKKRIKVLVLGSSHTLFGINPDIISPDAFNLANISQTLLYDKMIFENHLHTFRNLEYLIIPVDYFSLSQADRTPELETRKYFYEAQMNLTTGFVSDFDIKKYSLALAATPKMTYESIKQYVDGTHTKCDANGWAELKGVGIDNNSAMGKIIAQKHEDGSLDFKINMERLSEIIKHCRQKKVKVLLVTMPVTTHYADGVNKHKLHKIVNEASGLAREFANVRYINLFQDERFNNADFFDTDHLNIAGAKKCSLLVNDYLQNW